jgi:peptidoglycan/LPS O-acetylase OafA/YrhL
MIARTRGSAVPGSRVADRSTSDVGHGSRFDYIDALRGYAILGVIAVHTSQLFANLQWPLRLVADQGARGVQLFFVVSALTLTFSWNRRADGALPFWVRRAFRIAPMFWLALAYYVVLVDLLDVHLRWGPREIAWRDILASAALLHGLHPATIDSIVPGGWSIAEEAGFYAIFPLLMSIIRSWRAAVIALLLSAAALFAVSPFLPVVENLWELLPFQLPAFFGRDTAVLPAARLFRPHLAQLDPCRSCPMRRSSAPSPLRWRRALVSSWSMPRSGMSEK